MRLLLAHHTGFCFSASLLSSTHLNLPLQGSTSRIFPTKSSWIFLLLLPVLIHLSPRASILLATALSFPRYPLQVCSRDLRTQVLWCPCHHQLRPCTRAKFNQRWRSQKVPLLRQTSPPSLPTDILQTRRPRSRGLTRLDNISRIALWDRKDQPSPVAALSMPLSPSHSNSLLHTSAEGL